MDQGDDRMEARDYTGALAAYQGADAIMHLPMTTVAVARAQAALGLLLEARDTALAVVHTPAQPGETPPYAKARAEAQALADRLAPRIPSLAITLADRPAGLTVTVDGAVVPAAALDAPRKVNPGKHVIVMRAPGLPEVRVEVTAGEGSVLPVPLSLRQGAAPEPPVVPPPPAPAPAHGVSPLVYAGFSVGGAGLIVGAVTGGLSWSKTSQLSTLCPNKVCPAGSLATPTLLADVSDAGFALAIAGVGVGVVGVVLSRGAAPAPRTGVTIRPVVGPGSVGLAGEF
jgi:hypothetical protein